MKAKRADLVPGCVLLNDIYVRTAQPIMTRKTVLTKEHLDVLEAFLIDEVEVEPFLNNGEPFLPKQPLANKNQDEHISDNPLIQAYFEGVQKYKTFFQSWQKGQPVDIFSVIGFFNPLIDQFLSAPKELMSLYLYSGKADYLFHHAVAVGLMSAYFARKLHYSKKEVYEIGLSGLLADCGMAKLPPSVYEKANRLTKTEYLLLEKHPIYSYQMLKDLPTVKEGVVLAVLQHHERLDGSGYPLKLSHEQLHPYGKVIAVIDVFHAMICLRPYRPKHPIFKVLEMIYHDQFGKFDHKIISSLMDEIARFSLGTKVMLSNHQLAEIVFTDPQKPTRPIVRLENGATLALANHPDLYIEDILS